MKREILSIFYRLCGWLGVLRLFYAINSGKTVNITYHNVLPDDLYDDSYHLCVSHKASVFESQIAHIAKRRQVGVDPNQKGACRITFDDGYLNQKDVAAKILEKHQMKGVFFVPFQPLEDGQTLVNDRILQWLSYVPCGTYRIDGLELKIEDATRETCAGIVHRHLLANPGDWKRFADRLDEVVPFSKLKINPKMAAQRFTPLTATDLEEMRAQGHRIGCHGWDHRPLASLGDRGVAEELAQCRQYLSRYCNSKEFSYPFGGENDVTPSVARACREAGFTHAFMNVGVIPAHLTEFGNHAIARISLNNEYAPHVLDAKLSGFEAFLRRVLRRA